MTPEEEASYRELQKTDDYLKEIKEEREASIQAYIDAQASGEQTSFIDSAIGFITGNAGDGDPSSGSSSAVQPKARVASPKRGPWIKNAGEVIQEKGRAFAKSKDPSMPHQRIYQGGDPNKLRQHEARLIGA